MDNQEQNTAQNETKVEETPTVTQSADSTTTDIPSSKTEETPREEEKPRQKHIVNETNDRDKIKKGREEGTKQFQIDLKKAVIIFNNTLDLIKDIIIDYEGERTSDFFKYVLESEKSVYSNLALCHSKLKNPQKSIEYDLYIIEKIDKNFDKSWARLIKSYLEDGDIEEAFDYYIKMKSHFNPEVLKKYDDILRQIQEKGKENKKISKYFTQIAKKKKSKFTMVAIISVIVLLIGAGIAYFYMNRTNDSLGDN